MSTDALVVVADVVAIDSSGYKYMQQLKQIFDAYTVYLSI